MPRSPEIPSLWRPLRTPTFRNLLIADVVSDVGAFMQSTGAAWRGRYIANIWKSQPKIGNCCWQRFVKVFSRAASLQYGASVFGNHGVKDAPHGFPLGAEFGLLRYDGTHIFRHPTCYTAGSRNGWDQKPNLRRGVRR